MQDFGAGGFQPKIGAITGKASVVSKALGVVSKADLIIGIVVTSVADHDFTLAVPLETRTRHHVEHAVSTVSIVRGESAALYFQIINIFRVELWPDVGRNAGVRQRHSIDQPRNLMPTSDV